MEVFQHLQLLFRHNALVHHDVLQEVPAVGPGHLHWLTDVAPGHDTAVLSEGIPQRDLLHRNCSEMDIFVVMENIIRIEQI